MKKIFLCILVLLLVFPVAASALTFELDHEFSGATAPEGATPWLEATFTDTTPGHVTLLLEATNLTTNYVDEEFVGEFVGDWVFNFNPDYNAANLTVTDIDISALDSPYDLVLATDNKKADGDGWFDIWFHFEALDFTDDEEISFDFSMEGLTASYFDFFSAPNPGGGPGPFQTAAHIQGIGDDGGDSGWIAPTGETIPEPATMLLLGSGLIGIAGFGRKKYKK